MNEIDSPSPSPRQNAASPPPKCAICLGTCSNKCFSDSCRHQFCFTCLLEWSKVKAECPLCKQPFKSIIYNIKSNDEYDEHVIVNDPLPGVRGFRDLDDYYLPPSPSRHFQFRTTFTVDPGGELAIQQMLLSHPLTTNSLYNIPDDYVLPRQSRFGRLRHTRRASSATSFRRSIYLTNMWVYAPPDVTGRYRECTPQFFSENPAARNRLVPWLNRELNALLRENTQQVMRLVDVIMDHLPRWHIRSRAFKNLLENYLASKTEHFIHEFYNFMRSPYDMIGYDRHVIYSNRPHSPTYLISDQEDDSDVTIVNISEPITVNNNPFRRPTIEVIEINSDSSRDSDVIIGENPVPEVVLIDSDSNEGGRAPEPPNNINSSTMDSDNTEVNRKPVLPLKIRLKRKRQSKEKRSRNKKRCCSRCRSSSFTSSSSDDSTDSTSSSNSSTHKRSKRKYKHKKLKARNHKESKVRVKEKFKKIKKIFSETSDSDTDNNMNKKPSTGFDSDDCIPLSEIKHQELKKQKLRKPNVELAKSHTITSFSNLFDDNPVIIQDDDQSKPSCSRWKSRVGTYEQSSCQVPSGSSSSRLYPSVSNTLEDSSFQHSDPNSYPRTSMTQFDSSNRYDPYSHYPMYGSTVGHYNISPISVGSRYYDGPDFSLPKTSDNYSPPLALGTSTEHMCTPYNNLLYGNDCHCENLHGSCTDNKLHQYYSSRGVEAPSRVNVAVGTSPIHSGTDFTMYESYCNPHSSNSHRLQSVIVKKEDKDHTSLSLTALSSDSDTN